MLMLIPKPLLSHHNQKPDQRLAPSFSLLMKLKQTTQEFIYIFQIHISQFITIVENKLDIVMTFIPRLIFL